VRIQPVENLKGAVELCEGVVHVRWTRGAFVAEEDALAVMARASALCPDRPRPMLVAMNRLEGVEHRARNVFARPWPLTRIAVVGASAVDRVIVDFYRARHSPHCPTKFFTTTVEAIAWLEVGANTAEKTPALLAQDAPVFADAGQETVRDAQDPDIWLNVLLERLDVALMDIRADVNGLPLFAVEATLTRRLREVLPGVQFTAQDIRKWSTEVSS
jgi:hypothetical protein